MGESLLSIDGRNAIVEMPLKFVGKWFSYGHPECGTRAGQRARGGVDSIRLRPAEWW